MSYIKKPNIKPSNLPRNALGLTVRDYEGAMSTLCAGCGHDSISSAVMQAYYELDIEPHRVAKVSGIGCSSKTPTYFLGSAHGFNSVHGRMPSIATGAYAANGQLNYIGVSGDGDSLSIGLGQLSHAMRRNVNMLYLIENNGVYGLTKGQFSASADVGSKAKKGSVNQYQPIDPALLAMSLGCSFVARSFSGDKKHLVPLLKAGIMHPGFALLDIISPCVTFNDHEGSTKSYAATREHQHATVYADFIPNHKQIKAESSPGDVRRVRLHDGSQIVLRSVDENYDPTDRASAFGFIEKHHAAGEVVTGLLYIDDSSVEFHELLGTTKDPLALADCASLIPGNDALRALQSRWR